MAAAQKVAGFSLSQADTLRKAMGKKDIVTLNEKKNKFMDGCKANNLDLKICEKIWSDWQAFAQYAFNKSHSTCYAFVAFQTAWLKANYPPEYMAAVLTHIRQSWGNQALAVTELDINRARDRQAHSSR